MTNCAKQLDENNNNLNNPSFPQPLSSATARENSLTASYQAFQKHSLYHLHYIALHFTIIL